MTGLSEGLVCQKGILVPMASKENWTAVALSIHSITAGKNKKI